jgi:hypothetical protein
VYYDAHIDHSLTDLAGPDRYQLVREIGRGGMGVVYEAVDRTRNVRVALKRLDRVDPTALLRFKREFRARADVVHPNLVTLHELVGDGDRWFFTMELLDGIDVLTHVARDADPQRPKLRRAITALVDGLEALHGAGLVHRDVKPSNVLVTSEGRVVLLDFGLIARAGARDSDQVIIGTPAYLSPELVSSARATPAADWYAVGVMLYEALSGRLPFDGAALQLLMDKTSVDPPDVRMIAPDAPRDLAELTMALLRRSPGERPDAAELRARLGGAPAPRPTARPPEAAPFVGRDRELGVLEDALERALTGRCAVVRVHGESGIGKTRLVRQFLDDAQRRHRALVLEGRCYEREAVPYQGVDSLIDSLTSYLALLPEERQSELLPPDAAAIARLFPVLRRLDAVARTWSTPAPEDAHLRRRGVAALRALLSRLATRRLVVLFLDDLQWSDVDGASLLADLAREPDAPAVLILATFRDDDTRGAERALDHLPDAYDLPVGALAPEEAHALAATLLGDAGPRAAEVAREASGHPLFTHELARADTPAGGTPTLRGVLGERLARLPHASRRLLEVIAAAGLPLPLAIAERAAGGDHDAAAPLRNDHLIRSHGARTFDLVEPYHDQIRAAVLDALGDRLPALHRALAVALEESGRGDPEALAVYWAGAGEPRRAARYTALAADRAADSLAFARAAELYARAIELSPDGHDHALRLGLARALASAGHGVEAARAYVAAVPSAASTTEAVELQRLAAEQLLRCGRMREGVALFEQVFRATGVRYASTPRRALLSLGLLRARVKLRGLGFRPRRAAELPPETLARIDTCWAASAAMGFSDVIRGAEMQARGLLLALAAGEPFRVCRALSAEACFRAASGGEDDRDDARIIEAAEQLAREIDSPHGLALCGLATMLRAYCRGRWAETIALAGPTLALFRDRCTGAYWEATSTRHLRQWALAYSGRYAELAREIEHMFVDAETRDDVYARNYIRTGTSNLIWLAADRPDEATAQVEAAVAEWRASGFQIQDYNAVQALVHIDLYEGRAPRARARLLEIWSQLRRTQILGVQQIRIEALHLRGCAALAASGDLGEAREMARLIAREEMRWGAPLVRVLDGAVAARTGQRDVAIEKLEAAVAGFDAVDMDVHRELARLRLGEMIGGNDGARTIDAARDELARLGVVRPERWAEMWLPGYTPPSGS